MKIVNSLALIGTLALISGCENTRPTHETTSVPIYTQQVISTPAPGSEPVVTKGPAILSADITLANQVRQQLSAAPDAAPLLPNIQVGAQNGTVTLTGTVPSDQQRQLVDNLVRATPGVVGVNDSLQVTSSIRPPTGRDTITTPAGNMPGEIFNLHVQGLTPTDRTLAQRVLDGLRADTTMAALFPKVDINIAQGQVVLNGTVANQQQHQAVVAAVKRAAGENNVVDQVQVQTP